MPQKQAAKVARTHAQAFSKNFDTTVFQTTLSN
jgi:hypothetical protein